MSLHMPFNNKMKKMTPLLDHPEVKDHIPDTRWYSDDGMKELLSRYGTVFVKPNKGRIGIGVMRVKHLGGSKYHVHYLDHGAEFDSLDAALKAVTNEFNPKKKYIMQQGIDLAEVLGRPFDFRIIMHKIDNEWTRTAWCAKVSPQNLVVTNHARGGIILTVKQALAANNHLFNADAAMEQLSEVTLSFCKALDKHYSFAIIGFDMAIDKQGHIWFIEANTTPDHKMFKKLDQPALYRTIRERDRMIRALSKKLREEMATSASQ